VIVASDKNKKKGLAARSRQRAQADALARVKSLAYDMFIAGRHRARCELDFGAAVQQYKDGLGFKGRFVKGSDAWSAMLAATDPVYRRLEIARHLEKHAQTLLIEAWRDAHLEADEADFWSMSDGMSVDASAFLLDYYETNRLTVTDLRDTGLEDEEGMTIRRAEANTQAAADLMAEVGINV